MRDACRMVGAAAPSAPLWIVEGMARVYGAHLRSLQGVKVVTGVNLAMLVDFVFHVSLDAEAAAEHAMAAGTKAIRTP